LILAILGVFCATSLIPTATSADTNLVIGGQAVIAYANGDQVRLRQDIGYESTVLANYGEGTWVTVLDGPFTDSDGNYWYQVSVGDVNAGGQSGFIVADYLALEGGVPLETVAAVEEEGPAPETSAPAVGAVIGTAWVAGTNGDGVRCRAGADASSAVITVLPEATVIELTGAPIDIWQPINCGGSGGYVSLEFVSYEPPAPAAPVVSDPEPVLTDEPTTEGSTTDETGEGEASPPPATEVTGTLVVTGTNGDGVRCRARAGYDGNVITVLAEGTSVDLAGAAQGEWQPVFCGGVNGFVFATFLGAASAEDTGDEAATEESEALVTAAAVGGPSGMGMVTGTNGDGVRCRSAASTSSSTIMVLAEGADVTLRGGVQGDWQPVICANMNGFIYALYVTAGGTTGGETDGTDTSQSASSGTARVDSTGGLNCRTGPGLSNSVITVLANNSTVSLRDGSTSGWQAVTCGGQNGFASSTYLDFGTDGSDDGDDGSEDPPSGSNGSTAGFATGSQVQVTNTGGGGLRLRSAAGYSGTVIAVIGEGVGATVRNGSTGDWVAVTYNGSNGYVHKDYLRAGTGTSNPTTPPPTNPSPTTSLSNGDHARVTDSLNLRYEATYSSGVAAVAPAGTVVLITGSPSNGFYPMNWDGLKGYMHGDYLDETTSALSERGGSASQPGTSPGGTQSGTGAGNSIVDYAMRYLGYPYVWATAGPSSFDCSGFINWVVKNVVGRDIGRGLFTQVAAGGAVSRSALQPGDLVFFQNTYTTGLSHGGIYIGNNQFIHAENPSTGVRISDLNSNYYSSRWYGAVRL
jgi:cell wall-associated NlpC family hydrolase